MAPDPDTVPGMTSLPIVKLATPLVTVMVSVSSPESSPPLALPVYFPLNVGLGVGVVGDSAPPPAQEMASAAMRIRTSCFMKLPLLHKPTVGVPDEFADGAVGPLWRPPHPTAKDQTRAGIR